MATHKKNTASTSTARRVEREDTQEPGAEFDNALDELGIQPPRITTAQKGKGVAVESSPVPAPVQDDGMNLDEDDTTQRDEIQRNTAINGEDSDDPVEADGAEHGESSPAKEAASRQVKFIYKLRRLRDQEERRADEHKKKLERELAERMRIHNEELARSRERGEEHLREIDREFDSPPRAAASTSNHKPAPKTRARSATEAQKPAAAPKHQNLSTPGRTTPGAKRTKKSLVPTITLLAAEDGMVAEAGSVARAPPALSKHGRGRRVSFNCQPVTSMHEPSQDLQSSVRSVSGELQTNLDAPPTPFQHRLVSPGGGGEPMSLSPPLALFDDDYDVEMGVYVVSGEKLKVFLANRAGSVATSQAAHAITNLMASGGRHVEDRMQGDQDPRFEGKPIIPLSCRYTAHTG
jgi:hypothetical protein